MKAISNVVISTFALVLMSSGTFAETKVVTSIKPVHSLVAAVMQGVGEPSLIIKGARSPHDYALKPSQAAQLQDAQLVFWIGHELETFLEKPIKTIASRARSVELFDAQGLVRLKLREGGAFEEHKHEGHGDTAEAGHDDHAHGDEGPGELGQHVWLDPQNAKALVREIKRALTEFDSTNAAIYDANAKAVMAKLDALTGEVAGMLGPVRDKGFIVFHDAYQYFEKRFGLRASGSITVNPDVMPGAERVREIRAKVESLQVACVFSEPQFEPKLVTVVTEGTPARSGIIDPLGAALDDGPDLYFDLIRNMARSIRNCLSEAS